jgi:hypothetical protein
MKWITMLILSKVPGKLGYWAARRWHRLHKTAENSWDEIIRRKRAKTQETTTAARRYPR